MSNQDFYSVVIKARVLRLEPLDEEFSIAYLEVDKTYRDDISITKNIRLVGRKNEAPCYADLAIRFEVGRSYFIALKFDNPEGQGSFQNPIPPSINQWTHTPHLCDFSYLRIVDNYVRGSITHHIREYPLSEFDKAIEDCSFSSTVLNRFLCQEAEYYISPNPSDGYGIEIRSKNTYLTHILEIQIYDSHGICMYQLDYPRPREKIDLPKGGIYYARIICAGRIVVKKIVVDG